LFKRATGLTFTNFLSRVRIERSKNLLINPQLRVSEIAYEVGFQSLTHFNRVFLKLLGQSPTEYRLKLQDSKKPICR
jgi:AraC-like DNA-binding protein